MYIFNCIFTGKKVFSDDYSAKIEDDGFVGAWTSDRMRKATKKEIADYMLKINREKYNI